MRTIRWMTCVVVVSACAVYALAGAIFEYVVGCLMLLIESVRTNIGNYGRSR